MGAGAGAAVGAAAVAGVAKVEISARILKKAPASHSLGHSLHPDVIRYQCYHRPCPFDAKAADGGHAGQQLSNHIRG